MNGMAKNPLTTGSVVDSVVRPNCPHALMPCDIGLEDAGIEALLSLAERTVIVLRGPACW